MFPKEGGIDLHWSKDVGSGNSVVDLLFIGFQADQGRLLLIR